jgi:diguanylate cyclase (GGDEF)-like protein
MAISSLRALLIEDSPADARVIEEALAESPEVAFDLDWADSLAKGLQKLDAEAPDLVLLDLQLPDSRGLDTFNAIHARVPAVPIVVLTVLDDGGLALKALRKGAQDYLVKGRIDPRALARSMQYALVRHRMQIEGESPTWVDALTNLYNRQGFLVLGEQLLRLADEFQHKLALFYADVQGLERINQAYGRESGDAALRKVAAALRETFHDSELMARVGGGQFVLVCYSFFADAGPNPKDSLVEALHAYSRRGQWPHLLTLNWGVSVYDPAKPVTLASLIHRAEAQADLVFPG